MPSSDMWNVYLQQASQKYGNILHGQDIIQQLHFYVGIGYFIVDISERVYPYHGFVHTRYCTKPSCFVEEAVCRFRFWKTRHVLFAVFVCIHQLSDIYYVEQLHYVAVHHQDFILFHVCFHIMYIHFM